MRLLTPIFTLIFLVTLGCANQTAPTGGPKDEDPPKLLSSNPPHESINVKTTEIELEFNELIKLNNAKEEIIITPRVSGENEFKHKRNRAFIIFENQLEDSTTYTINFREGIQDLTEGNSPENLKIAFSTGDYLDSLSISGVLTNNLINQPSADFTVALYAANDTLNIFNSPPLYLTKTDKKGNYLLENLKPGRYQIYALKDKNRNSMLDSKNEKYGFYPELITLDSALNQLDFNTVGLDVREIEQISNRQNGTVYDIKYNKYLVDFDIINPDSLYANFFDETHTTIQVFNPGNIVDSLQVILQVQDSISSLKQDTIYLKYEETQRPPTEFTTSQTIDKIILSEPKLTFTSTFNKPISKVNYDSIYLYIDSLNIIKFDTSQLTWNKYFDQLTLNYELDPNLFQSKSSEKKKVDFSKKLSAKDTTVNDSTTTATDTTAQSPTVKPEKDPHLYLGQSAFISVQQDSSTLKEHKLVFTNDQTYGTILIETKTEYNKFEIQLLDKQYKVVRTIKDVKSHTFKFVNPAEYFIRVLIDANENGKWDTGNINILESQEPIYFYTNSEGQQNVVIRANWELGPLVLEF